MGSSQFEAISRNLRVQGYERVAMVVETRRLHSKPLAGVNERNRDFSSTNFIDSGVNYNHNV
jgi:hypothetical protein